MNEGDGQETEVTTVENDCEEDPEEKIKNYMDVSEAEPLFIDEKSNSGNEIIESYYEPIDPSQPSTSRLQIPSVLQLPEKFHFTPLVPQRNRLRAHRSTSLAIAEAAQKNGMQTVNRSGSRFVVPITMQAHPTPITDRQLDEKDDILSQDEAYPYCCLCHSIVKTWRGFEYHVLRNHIKYRAFRCFHCQKESFYTEEEGRFHLSTHHPGDEVVLLKEFDENKENSARNAFKHIFMMCRDGPEITRERVFGWETDAAQQVMKFPYLRFKRPILVVKKPPCQNREAQTDMPLATPILFQPLVNRHRYQAIPLDYQQVMHYHPHAPLLPGNLRPRSTATQHDEDPRDREKRVAALMHAVTSSHD